MIEYIINNGHYAIVYQSECITRQPQNALSYVKTLCEASLFTLDGYLKAVRKLHIKHYQIPIYFHDELMLVPTKRIRDYDNLWINVSAIRMIEKTFTGITIVFHSDRSIHVPIALNRFKARLHTLFEIRNIKVKHFHISESLKCIELVI